MCHAVGFYFCNPDTDGCSAAGASASETGGRRDGGRASWVHGDGGSGTTSLPVTHLGACGSSRWDPHPLPEGDSAPLGAAYLGQDVLTCLAEVYQATRFVDVDRNDPYLTAFRTTRDVELADLRGCG